MRVIVAGSRSVTDGSVVFYAIVRAFDAGVFDDVTEVVSGTARGVDRLGEEWALLHGVPLKRFPADWDTHGKKAGYLRNVEMAEYADALVAVWDGESKGTRHMVNAMKERSKPFLLYRTTDGKEWVR